MLNVVTGKLSCQVGHLDLLSLSMKNFQTNFMFLSGKVFTEDLSDASLTVRLNAWQVGSKTRTAGEDKIRFGVDEDEIGLLWFRKIQSQVCWLHFVWLIRKLPSSGNWLWKLYYCNYMLESFWWRTSRNNLSYGSRSQLAITKSIKNSRIALQGDSMGIAHR